MEKSEASIKLKAKLRKKRENRNNNGSSSAPSSAPEPIDKSDLDGIFNGETDILKMMESVNKILKTNPQMVHQISKCVSNVMGNKNLMDSLAVQLEEQIKNENLQDQTLHSKSPDESTEASSNESIQ